MKELGAEEGCDPRDQIAAIWLYRIAISVATRSFYKIR